MKRYEYLIRLSNGDEVHAKSVGEDSKDALTRLQERPEYVAFAEGTSIKSIELLRESEAEPPQEEDYVLTPSLEREGWWCVADRRRNVVVRWQQGAWNETHIITPLNDQYQALDLATALREISEYVLTNYKHLM